MWRSRSAGVRVWRSRSAGVRVWRSRSAGVRVWRSRSADVRVWRSRSAGVKVWRSRSAGVKVWRSRSAGVKVWRSRSADVKVWRCRSADVKVWRCSITAAFLRRTLRRRSREKRIIRLNPSVRSFAFSLGAQSLWYLSARSAAERPSDPRPLVRTSGALPHHGDGTGSRGKIMGYSPYPWDINGLMVVI